VTRRRRSRKPLLVLLGASFLLGCLAAGCRQVEVRSIWRDREIRIDGSRSDWQGIDVYNFEDKDLLLGLANDEESLCLLLVTPSRALGMQALSQGLTASFQAGEKGGEETRILRGRSAGAGAGPSGRRPKKREDDSEQPEPSGRSEEGAPWGRNGGEEMIERALHESPDEIWVLMHGGEDTLRFSSEDAAREGIEERAGYQDEYFILEMKVPLVKDAEHPHAIGVSPVLLEAAGAGGVVRLDLHVPEQKGRSRPSEDFPPPGEGRMFSQDGGDEDPDDGGTPGDERRGGMGRGGPGEGRRAPHDGSASGLDLKLVVRLSGRPAGS
jgi:hypothetical protein